MNPRHGCRTAAPTDLLSQVVPAYQAAGVVFAAVRLGMLEALAEAPAGAVILAERLGLDTAAAERLLGALAALGLARRTRGAWRLPPSVRRRFLPGRPGYLGDLLRHQERMWRAWRRLPEIARGESPGGGEEQGPEATREFVLAMEANAARAGAAAADAVGLAGVRSLLDVGGGPGTYARRFLRRSRRLEATVFDRPEVVAVARDLPANRRHPDRLRFRAGDLLRDDLGGPWDLIWASNVLHALGEEEALQLFRSSAAALAPGGRFVLHDFFLDDSRGAAAERAAVFAVHMLVATPRGEVRRTGTVRALLRAAGFGPPRLLAAVGSGQVWEARPRRR